MACCSKRNKNFERRLRRNKIHAEPTPKVNENKKKTYRLDNIQKIEENKKNNEINKKQREEFHKKFISEIIACGFCNEKFALGDSKLQINCNGCDKFFHCHIAGKCNGENCTVIINNKKEYSSYCLSCVNPMTIKNGFCKCKKCEKL